VPKPGEFFVVSNTENPSYSRKLLQTASFSNLPDTAPVKPKKPEEMRVISSQLVSSAIGKAEGRFKSDREEPGQNGVTMTSLQNEMKRQMSHTAFSRKEATGASVQFDKNIGLLDLHATMDERFKDTIKTKQEQLLANPHMKTSMTTNIRNIMSSHDKGMLTATSRLLHAEVRFQEQEERSPLKSQIPDGGSTSKSVSTLDLLKLSKGKSRYNQETRSINAMSHI
jgi:hypothetical protein